MRKAIRQTLDELEQQRQAQVAAPRGPNGHRDRDALMLAVGPESGQFLNTLLRASGARCALEIGGSMGYSTIWQAEAIEQNGGHLITIEQVPSKVDVLRRRIAQAEVDKTVQVLEGDARTLIGELDGPFDFVLVDAWKSDYPTYFDLVFPKLKIGGLIVADNISRPAPPDPAILEYVERARNHSQASSQLVPIGSGLELTVKIALAGEVRP
ncbi:MAG: O-methyltransferase [Polyangiaceae bacterium]|jgi:predicted O-methyltransferase YrrM